MRKSSEIQFASTTVVANDNADQYPTIYHTYYMNVPVQQQLTTFMAVPFCCDFTYQTLIIKTYLQV